MLNYRFLPFLTVMLMVFSVSGVLAQEKEPTLPAPIQALVEEGAQIRYLGKEHGLDGWITIKNGQEQYFYVTEDGKAVLMGLLFDKDGKLLTVRQVRNLQEQNGDVLQSLIVPLPEDKGSLAAASEQTTQFKTPAEQLLKNIEESNWIALGDNTAPVIYSFIDPQCPHCHAFIGDLRRNYIDNGLIQVRIVPVGFRAESKAQAAFLLAAPDPQLRWFRHLDGDDSALPITPNINEQGVERNMAIMQSWKLDVTPLTVYRAANGRVKLVQGRAKDVPALVADLPKETPAEMQRVEP